MIKILKNLKKSIGRVVIIIVLLCIQAWADLLLPDYTSKIVNTGIQSGGIETAIPEIISKKDMENLNVFTQDDEAILQNYTLVGKEPSKKEQKIIKKYLGKNYEIETNEIYVLKDIDKEQRQQFEEKMATPLMHLATITNKETQNDIKNQITR